jgi:hypothetical protein
MNLLRGRLAPCLGLLLMACHATPDTEARLRARQEALDPPRLWRMDALGADGRTAGVRFVCADTPLKETFTRLSGEVEGVPCRVISGPVVKPGLFAFRCGQGGRTYAMASQTAGDLDRDFRLTLSVTPLGGGLGPARTVRRFRRLGACPAGWRVGDQGDGLPRVAAPGARP